MSDAKRPILVTLVGGLEALAGAILIIFGALALLGVTTGISEDLEAIVGAAGIVAIVVGIIPFIIGYGMLKGWKIMWYLGAIFAFLGIVVGLLTLAIPVIIVEGIILFYLTRSGVKAFFGI